jgi:glucokinase
MKKVLAFDIGGTNTRLALVNEKFEVEKRMDFSTVVGDPDGFMENCIKLIEQFPLEDVVAIGAGVPGLVNRETGEILDLPHVKIKNVHFGKILSERFKLPVYLRNDAEVACLGEAYLGVGKDYERVFFITISTGLGGALCVDQENQDYVTEIGHTKFMYKNTLQEYGMISGINIKKLIEINKIQGINSAKEMFDGVRKNDPEAVRLYDEWFSVLNKFVRLIIDSYNPDVICMTGGLLKDKDVFFEKLQKENPDANITLCHFSEGAGVMGASIYALRCAKII